MAWSPISLIVPQYETSSGTPASGYVLKAYEAGTSTNTPFATDSTGVTQATSIALNSSGYPEVSGNIVIPHIDQTFKLALYPTQAAADANSGATWSIDNLTPITNVAFGNSVNSQTANYTLLTSDKGKLIYYSGAGGVTLDLMAAEDAGDGFAFMVENDTSGTVTLDGDGAEEVNGATTFAVLTGVSAIVVCNGTSWRALEVGNVTLTGTQTLTNKTLTSPTLTDATLTDPVINGTATGSGTIGGSIVVPLARMGTVIANASSTVSSNTDSSYALEASSAAHKFFQLSVYEQDGVECGMGAVVTSAEAVSPTLHAMIIRRHTSGQEVLRLVNGTGSSETFVFKVYKLTET